jgi:hypothetical protein
MVAVMDLVMDSLPLERETVLNVDVPHREEYTLPANVGRLLCEVLGSSLFILRDHLSR